jgi:hypothetical protein
LAVPDTANGAVAFAEHQRLDVREASVASTELAVISSSVTVFRSI